MIYDSKEQAEKAAEYFAMGGFNAGFYVSVRSGKQSVDVGYSRQETGPWHYESFKYSTLKKGDLCWCWNGNDPQNSVLRIFVGECHSDRKLFFSDSRKTDIAYAWNHYEQTGLNIYDGGKNDER